MSLAAYSFNSNDVRTAGTPENPLFCLRDVCKILGVKNHHDKAKKLDDDEKATVSVDSGDGVYPTTFVTEAGLYSVILSCHGARTAETTAYKFRRWVTHDVLPAIRATGEYTLKRKPSNELEGLRLKVQDTKLKAMMMLAEEVKQIQAAATAANDVRQADWASAMQQDAMATTLAICKGLDPANSAPAIEHLPKRTVTELMTDIGGDYATYTKQSRSSAIGRSVAQKYRERHSADPPTTRKRLASGQLAPVKLYAEADWDWIKAHILAHY